MNENIHLGRVVGETEAFVDIELCGHDVRNLLAVHAQRFFVKKYIFCEHSAHIAH